MGIVHSKGLKNLGQQDGLFDADADGHAELKDI